MTFIKEELREKKRTLQRTLEAVKTRYEKILSSRSVSKTAAGNDILSLENQIAEINSLLAELSVALEENPEVPRRKEVPENPSILVTGTPPRDGVPSNARLIQKENGENYYVDADGRIVPRD